MLTLSRPINEDSWFKAFYSRFQQGKLSVQFMTRTALDTSRHPLVRQSILTWLIDSLAADCDSSSNHDLRRLEFVKEAMRTEVNPYTRHLMQTLLDRVQSEIERRFTCPACGCDVRWGNHGIVPYWGNTSDAYCNPYGDDVDSDFHRMHDEGLIRF